MKRRLSTLFVIGGGFVFVGCRPPSKATPPELVHIMEAAVPGDAPEVTSASFDRRAMSVVARREFEPGMTWSSYGDWLESGPVRGWDVHRGDQQITLNKHVSGDSYCVTIERVAQPNGLRLRISAVGMPD